MDGAEAQGCIHGHIRIGADVINEHTRHSFVKFDARGRVSEVHTVESGAPSL